MPGADIQNLSGGGSMPDTGGSPWEQENAADMQQLAQAKRQNLGLALLAAGLSTMAQPHYRGERGQTWRALGAGGLAGLDVYESGQAAAAKEIEDRQKERGLEAYRVGELQERQAGINEQNRRTDIMGADAQEKARHDAAVEQNNQTLRGIQQQNANANSARAAADAQRVQVEAAKYGLSVDQFKAKMKPFGADATTAILKGYGVANAEELGPYLGALPRDDATKLMNSAIVAARQKQTVRVYTDDNQKVHVLTLDKDGNIVKDSTAKEPAAPKGKAAGTDYSKAYAAVGLNPAGETASPAPAASPAGPPAGLMPPPPATRPPGVPANAVWGVSKSRGPGWKLPNGTFIPAGA